MNDHNMEEVFGFRTLSLDEPEERLQKTFEHSFHLTPVQDQQVPPESAQSQTAESSTILTTTTPDNGPWAKLPSPNKIHPYQPGITAEKLDAMAMDANHVFKSAQTPFPSPFTVPPSSSGPPTESSAPDTKEIPNWMLEDPNLAHQIGWDITDTSGPAFTSRDFALDWGTNSGFSTTVDPNITFGFSSYPTYESLSISDVIAEEHYRRSAGLGSPLDGSSSSASQGGFAKYGQMGSGEGTGASFLGHMKVTDGSAATDQDFQWTSQGAAANPLSPPSLSLSTTNNQQQWQTWRSAVEQDQDHDLDLNALDNEGPEIQ
ncbi:hypothetical protein BGZ65_004395 [Modicella reniformis]|uniref:Uncharacterized protein n=1 Tax=Modicella reniformis TaxID=1440133 RepID=A0A9P6STR3_9FUNG|nr:hypothetical protein BGZ65_004395 [Modicella reniformis]